MQISEAFGSPSAAAPTKPSIARYTVVETVVVRKSQDTKSAKVATLSPGETCEVIEVGGTNKSGRTRLRLADPAGWVSDRNKEGTRMLEEVVENRGWSTGSIDMSAFETGGAATQSFKASDGVGSIEESAAAEAAAASPAPSPTPSPLAGAVSAFGQQPPSPQQPTAVFGQQQQPASAFGQQPTEEGVPGKKEACEALLPVLAGLSDAGIAYMGTWVAAQGPEYVARVAALRPPPQASASF